MSDRYLDSEEVIMFYIGLGIGIFIGFAAGFFVSCLMVSAKRADEAMEHIMQQKRDRPKIG